MKSAQNPKIPRQAWRLFRVEAVGIDSSWEQLTQEACDYRNKYVYPYLSKKNVGAKLFQGPLARRIYVASAVRDQKVSYLTGVGHGAFDTYTGDHYDPIWHIGNYPAEEAAGKIVHLLSCQTAAQLGPDFVTHGCNAYFGYDINFTLVWDDRDIFFECDSKIDQAFADGKKASQVYTETYDLFTTRIDQLRAQGKNYVAAVLMTDRDHLRAPASGAQWGSQEAKLVWKMQRIVERV
jgi:hypothetical protein